MVDIADILKFVEAPGTISLVLRLHLHPTPNFMKTFGIVSYNIHCNFTNYGSALQSWALSQVIQRLGYNAKLIDYCPEVLVWFRWERRVVK